MTKDSIRALASDSRLIATVERVVSATAGGWHRGATRAFFVSVFTPFKALDSADRIGALGWTLIVAAVTHVLALVLGAPSTRLDLTRTPIGPLVLSAAPVVAVFLLGIGLLVGGGPVGMAWSDFTRRRLRRFVDSGVKDAPEEWIDARPRVLDEAGGLEVRAPRRGLRLAAIVASAAVVAVMIGWAISAGRRVSVQWTTVPEQVPLSPRTASFVWTSRAGWLLLQSDRLTRFELSPAASARILTVKGTGIAPVPVKGPTAVWATDSSGHVTVAISVDRPGPGSLTATDVTSGASRTITFTAR